MEILRVTLFAGVRAASGCFRAAHWLFPGGLWLFSCCPLVVSVLSFGRFRAVLWSFPHGSATEK